MSQRTLVTIGLAASLLALPACSPTIRKPRLESPGTAPIQRYNATQFDPYPQTDMGPEIVGGRPPDFAIPVPEVERANQYSRGERAINTLPPAPGVFVPTYPLTSPGLPPASPPTSVPTYPPATLPAYPPATLPTYPTVPTYPQASAPPPVEYRY
jgi:hypothetical protein